MAGSTYVFRTSDGTSYSQVSKLTDLGSAYGARLSVAIDGATVVVGAIPCNPFGSCDSGSANVFRTSDGGTTYGQVAKLTASDAGSNDKFAYSLDISGGVVAIGAMASPGAVYVFRTGDGRRRN